jgi:N-acetylglucosaminyldiphosphoundecaprenol N-acetyl-beta-D-mannosaminyltransferase
MANRFVTPSPAKVRIMGLDLDRVSEAQAARLALTGVDAGRGGWICPANLDVLRRVTRESEIRRVVDRADLVVADGAPLVWASYLQRDALPERVAGSSLVLDSIPERAARAGASVFLLGGDPGVADTAAQRLRERHPGLRLAGTHCPPQGFEHAPQLMGEIEAALRSARPDIVFVALGFPKQERLILHLRPLFPHIWFVACGISLSLLSGDVARAPRWVRRAGLEWLHRLVQEPRRLARRYLLDGIPFMARVLAGSLRQGLTRTQ